MAAEADRVTHSDEKEVLAASMILQKQHRMLGWQTTQYHQFMKVGNELERERIAKNTTSIHIRKYCE